MKNWFFPLGLSLLFIFSCQSSTTSEEETKEVISTNPLENLPRIWQLKEYELIDPDGNLETAQKESLERKALRDGYQLCFLPGQIGTNITGEIYEEFTWDFKVPDNTIVMKKSNGEVVLKNVVIEKGEKSWTLTAVENNTANIKMIGVASLTANLEEEPFHPLNNQWRIKATGHEELNVLKKRLLNFVTHYKYLFKASIDNPKRSFTNGNSDGIILIYKGAIGFIKEESIPSEWKYTFYDEYQAMDAYKQFKKYLNNKAIKKDAPEDWKPVNLQILEELEAQIKADIQ